MTLRSKKVKQRLATELNFIVDGTGTAAISSGGTEGTLVDNGTGDYTITYASSAKRVVSYSATVATDGLFASVSASNTAATVKIFDDAGAATDGEFCVSITLSDADEI